MTTLFDAPAAGYRHVDLQWGESLQSLAARELGDASLWPVIANMNGLVYPYVGQVASAGVAAYGDSLMVPAPSRQATTTADPDLVFERDVELRKGKIEAVDGDFSLISGVDNLRQALVHRITVDQGELPFHPEYGSLVRRLIGTINGPTAGMLAARYANAAVVADPRVSKINRSDAEVSGDSIRVDVEAQTISNRTLELSAGV